MHRPHRKTRRLTTVVRVTRGSARRDRSPRAADHVSRGVLAAVERLARRLAFHR